MSGINLHRKNLNPSSSTDDQFIHVRIVAWVSSLPMQLHAAAPHLLLFFLLLVYAHTRPAAAEAPVKIR
jgi:hypothetical protein